MTNTEWNFPSKTVAELDFEVYYKDHPCKCTPCIQFTPPGIPVPPAPTIAKCLRCTHPGNPANSSMWDGVQKEIDYSAITKGVLGL